MPALVKVASLAADATLHCTCLDIVLEVNSRKQLVATAAAAVTSEHETKCAALATHNPQCQFRIKLSIVWQLAYQLVSTGIDLPCGCLLVVHV